MVSQLTSLPLFALLSRSSFTPVGTPFAVRHPVVDAAVRRCQPTAQPAPRLSALAALPSHQPADTPSQAAQGDERGRKSWLSSLSRTSSWQFKLLSSGVTLCLAYIAYSTGSASNALTLLIIALVFLFS